MSKDRPRNMAASARARLADLARKQHEDFQLVLTRYAIERLLYRLTRTAHAAEFVLKGAMLFRLWADQPHRPTRDLDLLGRGDPSLDRLGLRAGLCAGGWHSFGRSSGIRSTAAGAELPRQFLILNESPRELYRLLAGVERNSSRCRASPLEALTQPRQPHEIQAFRRLCQGLLRVFKKRLTC